VKIIASRHWEKQRIDRPDITDDLIELAIMNAKPGRDRRWPNALNAIARVPPSGRLLKVIYKRRGSDAFIITAYWLT